MITPPGEMVKRLRYELFRNRTADFTDDTDFGYEIGGMGGLVR